MGLNAELSAVIPQHKHDKALHAAQAAHLWTLPLAFHTLAIFGIGRPAATHSFRAGCFKPQWDNNNSVRLHRCRPSFLPFMAEDTTKPLLAVVIPSWVKVCAVSEARAAQVRARHVSQLAANSCKTPVPPCTVHARAEPVRAVLGICTSAHITICSICGSCRCADGNS
jgi:hypothetical protein